MTRPDPLPGYAALLQQEAGFLREDARYTTDRAAADQQLAEADRLDQVARDYDQSDTDQ